ncbi:MAG: hypothetical protein ACRYFX_31895 [Janthinobacterium lividum]
MSLHAYPAAWAYNDAQRAAAQRWQQRGLLTPAQRAAIDAAHPVNYYQPVVLLRVGLLVATWLGGLSAALLLGVITEFHGGVLPYCLVMLAGTLLMLELTIRGSNHYHSGVDNALLYGALCAWAVLLTYCIEQLAPNRHVSDWLLGEPLLWFLLLVAAVPALLRYADPLVAAVVFASALLLLVNVLLQIPFGRLLLPFAVMATAAGLHAWLRTLSARPDYFYYRSCILTLRTLALATIYLASNYLVVRQGNAALLGWYAYQGSSPQIPLAPLFYVLTAGMPLVYIGLGLRRHDRLLLGLGLLAVAFSLYTLRYYRAVLPPEVAATLGGLLLIALALVVLRYLRTPRHGFTTAPDDAQNPHFNLESLLVAQTAHVAAAPPEAGLQFGGGHSGGGGAEGRF